MAKLYFKYGAMGSSKTAQALITKFNYEEQGMTVWLIKPSVDTRDGADVIRSRIGLMNHARIITPEQDIIEAYRADGKHDVIIADEAQFFTPEQIDHKLGVLLWMSRYLLSKNLPHHWQVMTASGIQTFSCEDESALLASLDALLRCRPAVAGSVLETSANAAWWHYIGGDAHEAD